MIFKDYYKILELKTNKVSSEEIKNAYRLAVKKNHPDVNLNNSLAEEKIKDINEAYRILSNFTTKRKYDRIWLKNEARNRQKRLKDENKKNNSSFGELFNMFFGNIEYKGTIKKEENVQNPEKGENIETVVDISIEEAFYGLDKKISLRMVNRKNESFYNKNSCWNSKWRKNKTYRTRKKREKRRKKWRFIYKG